ncbi:hypothetical protein D3C78_1784630 [compost metagenome]
MVVLGLGFLEKLLANVSGSESFEFLVLITFFKAWDGGRVELVTLLEDEVDIAFTSAHCDSLTAITAAL